MHSVANVLLLFGITSLSLAAPQLSLIGPLLNDLPLLATPPPSFLSTQNPSPECAAVNQGTLLCCESTFNGDIPIVVQLSDLVHYKLNPNSINCIYGMHSPLCLVSTSGTDQRCCAGQKDFTTCNPGTQLCCEIDSLANVS